MIRPIAISLSPNTSAQDVLQTIRLFFSPWNFFQEDGVRNLEQWFRYYFKISYAIGFNSARSSLFAILRILQIKPGDEIILQSFTCVAVPASIIAAEGKPVYVDINNNLTIDIADLERKITKKTKAILVQHTFGIPADLTKIMGIAKKHKLYVIEDVAHTIGATYKDKKLGTIGDFGFFSFGRDKAFSSVFGGMAITNNKELGRKLRTFQQRLQKPSFFWTLQQLFHPIAFFIIMPLYNFLSTGKIILIVLQKLHLLSFPVFPEEKKGKLDPKFIQKLPNPLAHLALFQLKKIAQFNKKREEIGKKYIEDFNKLPVDVVYKTNIPFLRFPILVKRRDEFVDFFKEKGIYIGKWYSEIIDPKGVDFKKIYYRIGSCPNAEYIAKHIVNLPTYPTMSDSDIEKVIEVLKQYDRNNRN